MKHLGLIGYPLSHSFSESYFEEKFRKEQITGYTYRNYPISSIAELDLLVRQNPELLGLNVTIPYKQDVMPHLSDLDETARQVGAVNTIHISREADSIKMTGYNTDVTGFMQSLEPLLADAHKGALILGTGGASRAVAYVLDKLGITYQIVSRRPSGGQLHYGELCLPVIKKNKLIINTSPLGTYPDIKSFPNIPYDLLTKDHMLYDLVYNPEETEFLKMGRQKGARVKNGLEMLHLQAEAAWDIWTAK